MLHILTQCINSELSYMLQNIAVLLLHGAAEMQRRIGGFAELGSLRANEAKS